LVGTQGWPASEIAALSDSDVPLHYFDARRRRVALAPRTIRLADDFICPPEQEGGWKALQEKIVKGEDINSHLSTRHASLFNSDGLLSEWGVHHFHLGTTPHPTHAGFVSRTGPLVYALVTDQAFCAINVYTHQSFEDSTILESIHRNWPELIRRYRAKGVTGGVWTQEQRRAIRSKHANVLTRTKDGTVYMTIGIATSAAGISFEIIKQADFFQDQVRAFQDNFEKQSLAKLLPLLQQQGLDGEDEVEAELKLSRASVQVFFPKYNVLANVNFTEEPASSQ
jgi:hypothetical protein